MLATKLQMTVLKQVLSALVQSSMTMAPLRAELLFQIGSLSLHLAAVSRQFRFSHPMAVSTVLIPSLPLGLQLMVILLLTRPSHLP